MVIRTSPLIRWRKKIVTGLPSGITSTELSSLYEYFDELCGLFVVGAEGYLEANINVSKRLANGTPIVYHSLVLENETDIQNIKNAKGGDLVDLLEPPIAILVECPQLDKSSWPVDQTMQEEKVIVPGYSSSTRSRSSILFNSS